MSKFARHSVVNKYKNEAVLAPCHWGYSHRSKLESSVCQLLMLREKAGEIEHVAHEVHTLICGPLGHACDHKCKIEYIADFEFKLLKTGEHLFVEAKGFSSDTWPLKLRLYRHYGALPLEIWGGTWRYPRLIETVKPK